MSRRERTGIASCWIAIGMVLACSGVGTLAGVAGLVVFVAIILAVSAVVMQLQR